MFENDTAGNCLIISIGNNLDKMKQRKKKLVAPQIQIGRAAKTIGEIKKVKLDNAIIGQAAIKGTKGKVGKAAGGRMTKGPRGPKGV